MSQSRRYFVPSISRSKRMGPKPRDPGFNSCCVTLSKWLTSLSSDFLTKEFEDHLKPGSKIMKDRDRGRNVWSLWPLNSRQQSPVWHCFKDGGHNLILESVTLGSRVSQPWLTSYETNGTSFNPSKSQFLHVKNGRESVSTLMISVSWSSSPVVHSHTEQIGLTCITNSVLWKQYA